MSAETLDIDELDKLKETVLNYTDEVNCLCGQKQGELFKCELCMKTFCEICPSKPIYMDGTANCLECILNETEIYTSTPKKNQLSKLQP